MKPNGENIMATVRAITDENGEAMESCPHPKQKIFVDLGIELETRDLLRKKDEE